jgi:hypothetical protein
MKLQILIIQPCRLRLLAVYVTMLHGFSVYCIRRLRLKGNSSNIEALFWGGERDVVFSLFGTWDVI